MKYLWWLLDCAIHSLSICPKWDLSWRKNTKEGLVCESVWRRSILFFWLFFFNIW